MSDEKLYTVKDVAAALRVHQETIRRWLRDGKLKGVTMGGGRGGYRITETELNRVRLGGMHG